MRTVRTALDEIVCWFIWWVDAMDRAYPDGPLAGEDGRPAIKPCIPTYRVVLDHGYFSQEIT